ncbi:hypothetical protein Taro_034887 [Colocasia esculenta]|uniref:Uncharacterized protein n=1 Tax=Colocasia esculenta TaxID=4460 RepID=A0A843VSQ8_COLES|nr:hypothetical protein [Colocasia esculenta]
MNVLRGLCGKSRNGFPDYGFACEGDGPGCCVLNMAAQPVTFCSERDMSRCRVQKATEDLVTLRDPRAECFCMVMSLLDYRFVLYMAMVSGALAPRVLEERDVHVVDMGSFPTEPVTCEAHPDSFQVRESRRLLALRLVLSSVVAELGLHHQ